MASRGVTVVAKLIGGSKMSSEMEEIGSSVKATGDDVKVADDEAGSSTKGWALFTKQHEDTKRAVADTNDHLSKTHSILKGAASSALGFGASYLGISGIQDAVEGFSSMAREMRQLKSMGASGGSRGLDLLEAFKTQGLGASSLGASMKYLARNTQTAERQEYSYHASLANHAKSESGDVLSTQLGTQALAFKELGVSIQSFKQLSPEKQFETIASKLTGMADGANKTRIATQLLGRSATDLLPLFSKGAMGLEAQLKAAREFMPQLKTGVGGFDELEAKETRFQMASSGLELTLGLKLIPVITKLMGWFMKLSHSIDTGNGVWGTLGKVIGTVGGDLKTVVTWFTKTKAGVEVLIAVLSPLAVIWGAYEAVNLYKDALLGVKTVMTVLGVATQVTTGETLAWNTALEANPIGIIVVALVGLAMALVYAYEKISWFHNLVNAAFNGIKTGVTTAISFISAHWKLFAFGLAIVLTGGLAALPILVATHFKQIETFITGLPAKIAKAASGMWDGIKEAFRGAIDWIIKGWNSLHFKIPGFKIGPVGWKGFNLGLPHIPMLGEGGILRSHGSVIVGDRGVPELLTLPAGARVDPLSRQTRGSMTPGTWRPGRGGDLHVHIELARKEIAQAVIRDFRALEARAS